MFTGTGLSALLLRPVTLRTRERDPAAGRATFWTHLVCAKDGVAPVLEATIRWRKRELTTVHHRIRASVGVAEVKVTGFLLRGRGEWPEVIAELELVGVKRLQPEILTSKEDKTVLCCPLPWCPAPPFMTSSCSCHTDEADWLLPSCPPARLLTAHHSHSEGFMDEATGNQAELACGSDA